MIKFTQRALAFFFRNKINDQAKYPNDNKHMVHVNTEGNAAKWVQPFMLKFENWFRIGTYVNDNDEENNPIRKVNNILEDCRSEIQ